MPKKICTECIAEDYLNKYIITNGKLTRCSFCKKQNPAINFSDLSTLVREALENHYERTATQPSDFEVLVQNEFKQEWERSGSLTIDILTDEFGISEEPAKEILAEIEEKDKLNYEYDSGEDFDDQVHYIKKKIDTEKWSKNWQEFKSILQTESRFFNKEIEAFLNRIFKDLPSVKTSDGTSVITKIGPNGEIKTLYRARVFQSRDKLLEALKNPDIHLGPPPPGIASDGRMNARGISVFYGATDKETAIAEVRPPVGSKVITAKFKIVRNLQLLDLRNLKNAIESVSVFHPAYKQKMEKAVFISKLSKIITQPVMPGDEVFEYLPTQAIADFLSAQYRVVYDGIIFPSVQVKGEDKINVVLFNKSSKVRSYYLPKGTRTRVQDEEPDDYGTWKFYQVTHLVPPLKNIESDAENNSQVENANLEIEINSIEVNDINAVQFTWESHSVSRVKIENYKSPLTN